MKNKKIPNRPSGVGMKSSADVIVFQGYASRRCGEIRGATASDKGSKAASLFQEPTSGAFAGSKQDGAISKDETAYEPGSNVLRVFSGFDGIGKEVQ